MLLDFRNLGVYSFEKAETFAAYEQTLPPNGCTLHDLGESSDPNKKVYGVSYGNLDGSKPVLYLEGVIHGDHEWRGAHYLYEFMKIIANPHGTPIQSLILDLTQHFDVFTIPCVNPSGYENETYENANGVNLNRNFDYFWETTGDGLFPFSEPESQIIKKVVEQYKPVMFVDYHTIGGYDGFVVASGTVDNAPYRITIKEISEALIYNSSVFPARNNGRSQTANSRAWASNLDSSLGAKTMGFLFEAGSLESNEKQCTLSLYSCFMFCAYALNWYKTGVLSI